MAWLPSVRRDAVPGWTGPGNLATHPPDPRNGSPAVAITGRTVLAPDVRVVAAPAPWAGRLPAGGQREIHHPPPEGSDQGGHVVLATGLSRRPNRIRLSSR